MLFVSIKSSSLIQENLKTVRQSFLSETFSIDFSTRYHLTQNSIQVWDLKTKTPSHPHILVFLLLVLRRFCPLRCCCISLVRDRVSFVSVSGVSGTTSLNPGRSGGGISSGVLIWDLWSFRFPRFVCGCVGVAKSLSLSDMTSGAALPKNNLG